MAPIYSSADLECRNVLQYAMRSAGVLCCEGTGGVPTEYPARLGCWAPERGDKRWLDGNGYSRGIKGSICNFLRTVGLVQREV